MHPSVSGTIVEAISINKPQPRVAALARYNQAKKILQRAEATTLWHTLWLEWSAEYASEPTAN